MAVSRDVVEVREAIAALAYTRQWFEIYDWVIDTLDSIADFEWGGIHEHAQRMTRMRAIVRQQNNDEVAYKRAVPITALHDWLALPAPGLDRGGRRRVVIRIFCWEIDRRHNNAHDPQWIRLADDMSAFATRARALRWATAYDALLQAGRESRELRMTAIEIAFWTRDQKAKLL